MLTVRLMWRRRKSVSLHCSVWTHDVARAYVYAHVRAHVSVISEIKHSFQSLRYLLITSYLYTYRISWIYVMWDYLFVLIYTGDMTSFEESDRAI